MADFDFVLEHEESLRQVQQQKLAALQRILQQPPGQTVVIGTHGTALSMLMDHFSPGFGCAGFDRIRGMMPWVMCMTFEGEICTAVDEIPL